MKLTVRFDIFNLIIDEFPDADRNNEWYFEIENVLFVPEKGCLTTFAWDDFIENDEMARYLNKECSRVYIGETNEIIYKSALTIVCIELELMKKESLTYLWGRR